MVEEKVQSVDEAPTQSKDTRKKIYLVLGVIIIILIAGTVYFFEKKPPSVQTYRFTGYRYTIVYTVHSSTGNSTTTSLQTNDLWTATYQLGKTFSISQPFYNNVSDGTTMVTNIVCGTSGFSFNGSSLPFPFSVPTSLNASATYNNVIVRLTFTTPSEPYNGPFIYTAYFDYYL
jgi:hypothetical protein